jgi:Flp pilus assembly protein TadG
MKAVFWKRIAEDERGATAIEFALVAPAFLSLIVAVINVSLLGMSVASLHYAVEEGARCASVRQVCPEPASRYFAPGPSPVFTPSSATCGSMLNATVTFNLNAALVQRSIRLSATARYPWI